MSADQTRPVNRTIPLLIILPFVAITVVMLIGRPDYKHAAEIEGGFDLPQGTTRVKLITDVGNVTVQHGPAGRVGFKGATFLATGSEEQLLTARKSPFTLRGAAGKEPGVYVVSVSPLPDGFKRLPPRAGDEKDQVSPRLLRQMDVVVHVPADVALDFEAGQGNIGISSRQAATNIRIEKGTLMLQNLAGELTVKSRGGDTIVEQHRGKLDIVANGKTRVTLADLVADVSVVTAEGELDLILPRTTSCKLDAHSETGNVRNSLGLKAVPEGAGTRTRGVLGDGEHKVVLVAKAGTLTVKARAR